MAEYDQSDMTFKSCMSTGKYKSSVQTGKKFKQFPLSVIVTAAACLAIMTLVLLDFYANSYTKELLRYPNLPLTQKSKESITESYSP